MSTGELYHMRVRRAPETDSASKRAVNVSAVRQAQIARRQHSKPTEKVESRNVDTAGLVAVIRTSLAVMGKVN